MPTGVDQAGYVEYMVQRRVTSLFDDIDGSSAAESVRFGVDGVAFEIDLNTQNAAKFRRAVAPWMRSARRTGGRRLRGTGQH